MFGLMRRASRLPYCGTCKTLGTLYGHRSRFLLNHDTVFLAELLLEQSGQPEWTHAYRSFNCLALPRGDEPLPLALEYAATVAVVLAHFHVADHQTDSGKLRWRAAARLLSPSYHRAAARLRRWQFPLDEMAAILATQPAREARNRPLSDVAEPTAAATAMVFAHGAHLLGRADLVQTMHRLGHAFGYLIYLLDAYEDRQRDRQTGDFNPLLAAPEHSARSQVLNASADVEQQLGPDFAVRLRTNVEERLGLRPRVLHHHRWRKPIRDRWRDAANFARALRDREQPGILKGAAILASVSLMAFLFPHQARSADSWRHCLGVGMNLMALSAIFASTPPAVPPVHQFKPDAPKGSTSSCGNCFSGCCCDGCDCGDCCECGSCCDC